MGHHITAHPSLEASRAGNKANSRHLHQQGRNLWPGVSLRAQVLSHPRTPTKDPPETVRAGREAQGGTGRKEVGHELGSGCQRSRDGSSAVRQAHSVRSRIQVITERHRYGTHEMEHHSASRVHVERKFFHHFLHMFFLYWFIKLMESQYSFRLSHLLHML